MNHQRNQQMNQWRASFFRYLTFGGAFLLAACASQQQISPQATSGLTRVRAQAVQLKQQLSSTADSARTVAKSSGSDLSNSLNSLSANLDRLTSTLGISRRAVRSSQDQMTAYFASWDKQSRRMSEETQKTSKRTKPKRRRATSHYGLPSTLCGAASGHSYPI